MAHVSAAPLEAGTGGRARLEELRLHRVLGIEDVQQPLQPEPIAQRRTHGLVRERVQQICRGLARVTG
jgi:hypothetical protein